MLKWKIGNVTVTRVVEVELPGLTFIIPEATAENCIQIEWLAPHFITPEGEPIASVSRAHRRIPGPADHGRYPASATTKRFGIKPWNNRKGPFLDDIAEAGFPAARASTRFSARTLHLDHVGWNTMLVDGKWKPTFPDAKYLFGRIEWEHWKQDDDRNIVTLREQSIEPILEAGLETLVETDYQLTDEVWLEPTPGAHAGPCFGPNLVRWAGGRHHGRRHASPRADGAPPVGPARRIPARRPLASRAPIFSRVIPKSRSSSSERISRRPRRAISSAAMATPIDSRSRARGRSGCEMIPRLIPLRGSSFRTKTSDGPGPEIESEATHEIRDLLRAAASEALDSRESEHNLFKNGLSQIELADSLGFELRVGSGASLPRRVLALLGALRFFWRPRASGQNRFA